MDSTAILRRTGDALAVMAGRVTELVRSLDDVHAPIPGSQWTVREAAIHILVVASFNTRLAGGMPSSVQGPLNSQELAARNTQRIRKFPEAEPEKLAALIGDAVGGFSEAVSDRPGDQEVIWHAGLRMDLAHLAGIQLGELVIHGYDIAAALGRPWPIDPDHARLVLHGYGPCFFLFIDPERARGLTAAHRIDLGGGSSCVVRLVDGEYRLEPAGSGPVDATVSADPVAFLMVASGRLDQWAAVALNLLSVSGPRADLALALGRLFTFP
jgi:uncharacterized protein (TIGR03083 family)